MSGNPDVITGLQWLAGTGLLYDFAEAIGKPIGEALKQNMVDQNVAPPCPKCGQAPNTLWHAPSVFQNSSPCYSIGAPSHGYKSTEHLHYYCPCGWDWTGPTKEQEAK